MTLGKVNHTEVDVKEHYEIAGREDIGIKRVLIVDVDGDVTSLSISGSVYSVPPNTVTATYVGNQSGVTVVTPASGKHLQIIGVQVTSDDSLFDCKLEFATSGQVVAQHFEQSTLGAYIPVNITGDADETLDLTITGSDAQNWFLIINYAEVAE